MGSARTVRNGFCDPTVFQDVSNGINNDLNVTVNDSNFREGNANVDFISEKDVHGFTGHVCIKEEYHEKSSPMETGQTRCKILTENFHLQISQKETNTNKKAS